MADHKYTVRLDGEIQIYNATLKDAVRVGTQCARDIGFIDFSSRVIVTEEVCTCTWDGDGELHHRVFHHTCPVHALDNLREATKLMREADAILNDEPFDDEPEYHMPLSYARHIEGN